MQLRSSVILLFNSFLLNVLFSGCNTSDQEKHKTNKLIKDIDITYQGLTSDKGYLSEIADSVYYIKLKSPDSLPLSNNLRIKIYKRYLIVFDDSGQQAFLFNSKGDYLNRVSNFGQNIGEFEFASDFSIDEDKNEILIVESIKHKLKVFGMGGRFIRDVAVENEPTNIFEFNNKSLLLVTPVQGRNERYNHFVWISKNGEEHGKYRLNDDSTIKQIGHFNFIKYNNTIRLWQTYSDTILSIEENLVVKPVYRLVGKDKFSSNVADLSTKFPGMAKEFYVSNFLESPKYLFFEGAYNKTSVAMVYNKQNEKKVNVIYDLSIMDHAFMNDLDGGAPFWPEGQMDEKRFYRIWSPSNLKRIMKHPFSQSIKSKSIINKIKWDTFLNELTDEDNAIIQVVLMK